MTRIGYITLAFAGVIAVLEGAFRYREGLLQLPLMFLYLVWLVFIPLAPWRLRWRPRPFALRSSLVVLLLIAAPFIGARAGIALRDRVFRARLPQYEAVIRQLRAGVTPDVPWRLGHHVTHRPVDGDVVATFWWGGGFPVKHTVFVYHPGDIETDVEFRRAWRRIRPLAQNWYVAKD